MSEQAFNPREHLIQIRSGQTSNDYLPVQWRLVWFREKFPNGSIETEIVHLDLDRDTEEEVFVWNNEKRRSEKVIKQAKGIAIFKATVKDGMGGIATGTGSEKAASFGDFLEKAETKSIGRALAALGFGTQFTDDLDEKHRIVDSPVAGQGNGSTAPDAPTVAELRQRCTELHLNWEGILRQSLKQTKPDESLTAQDRLRVGQALSTMENRKNAAAASAK